MQSLEYLISVNQLNLSDKLKSILQDNEIYCLNDYFEFAIEIFKDITDLTYEDWVSIIAVYVDYSKEKKITEPVVCAALENSKTKVQYNALVISVFDEKYVVVPIRKGKKIYTDYIYRAISRGLVFLTKEDALSFAELIATQNKARVLETSITSATKPIYVSLVCIAGKKKSILSMDDEINESSFLQQLQDETRVFKPQRGYRLAEKAVERINKIYDYELAKLRFWLYNEDESSFTETTAEELQLLDEPKHYYVDRAKYDAALEAAKIPEVLDYTILGINAALESAKGYSLNYIVNKLAQLDALQETYNESAGVTEEDLAYLLGFKQGLRKAYDLQNNLVNDNFEVKIALIDEFGVVSAFGISFDSFTDVIKKGNCTLNVEFCASIEEVVTHLDEFGAFFLIVPKDLSNEDEDVICKLTLDFYARFNRPLWMVNLAKSFGRGLFNSLFLLNDRRSEDEE